MRRKANIMFEQLTEVLRAVFSNFGVAGPETTSETIVVFQSTIQWMAIALTALAGVSEARRRDLDFFGALVIAFVASVGGGTLRDLLLARYPLFWVASPIYLVTIFFVSTLGALIISGKTKGVTAIEPLVGPVRQVLKSDDTPGWVIVVDALGLGLWAYLGTAFALQAGASLLVAPVFGVMTAGFGGVLRDVFFAQVPSMFKRGQLYASGAAIGSITYAILFWMRADASISFTLCVAITFLVRMASVRYDIHSL